MTGKKWISEAIHEDEIKPFRLNLIEANVGAGKTTWALDYLLRKQAEAAAQEHDDDSHSQNTLFLIDTKNAQHQLLHRADNEFVDEDALWKKIASDEYAFFDRKHLKGKVVVMTYAKAAKIKLEVKDFGATFKYIICDEIHNLFNFEIYDLDQTDTNLHKLAENVLRDLIDRGVIVIGITATPRILYEKKLPIVKITVDEGVRSYETKLTKKTRQIDSIIDSLPSTNKKALIYTTFVRDMIKIEEKLGPRAIAIFSPNCKTHHMNETQKKARDYLLEKQEFPPDYDYVIINASCGTSINIFGQIDVVIIDHSNEDIVTQVRGRYRKDLDLLYVKDKSAPLVIPDAFLNVPLDTDEQKLLCENLNWRDEQGHPAGFTKLKNRLKKEGNYDVIELPRENNIRRKMIVPVR